jgi:hypothetical protein
MPEPCSTRARCYDGDYMDAGRQAEEIVMRFLRHHPHVIAVEDFRQIRAVHEADIDFAIKTSDGRVRLAEVKSDRHLHEDGNVIFEVLRINHTCHADRSLVLGWSSRSPATYFIYYSPRTLKLYQCASNDLRAVLQKWTLNHRSDSLRRFIYIPTDSIKSTIAILIPYKQCVLNGISIFRTHDVSDYVSPCWKVQPHVR